MKTLTVSPTIKPQCNLHAVQCLVASWPTKSPAPEGKSVVAAEAAISWERPQAHGAAEATQQRTQLGRPQLHRSQLSVSYRPLERVTHAGSEATCPRCPHLLKHTLRPNDRTQVSPPYGSTLSTIYIYALSPFKKNLLFPCLLYLVPFLSSPEIILLFSVHLQHNSLIST